MVLRGILIYAAGHGQPGNGRNTEACVLFLGCRIMCVVIKVPVDDDDS